MIRVRIICEGQTEEEFVNNLLSDHLRSCGVDPIPIVIRERGSKGGDVRYRRVFVNVRNSLLQERTCYCTTFIDYYGLPREFPGKSESKTKRVLSDIATIFNSSFENALQNDIGENSIRRFIPYVQMHEFEALLFSDPVKFAVGIGRPDLQKDFGEIANGFVTPEHINDSPNTAPSKQVMRVFPGYERQKWLLGVLAALEIGLPRIREQCPLFDAWIYRMERLPPPPA